ncbi:MAG TPA: MerR family transcriptional regulator [Firmicutes bacterium]|jgi:DNA-binding transcriptional MerR regulator|nr:MerR family transcriptional regulator [Bacillota bacterium]
MFTIGQLCRESALSRSTLLYYDEIGLLKPSARTRANYRYYTEEDLARLHLICLYRETGMPLEEIRQVLEAPPNDKTLLLEKHLQDLSQSLRKLTIQRQIIARMILQKMHSSEGMPENSRPSAKDVFTQVLAKAGLQDGEQFKLHQEFERSFPQEHQAFLEFLGMAQEEITRIRQCCS